VRVLLNRKSYPRDFYFVVVCLHLVLILHLKGLNFSNVAGSALLVWISVRYLYIRLCKVLKILNNEHFSYKMRTVLASSYSELRGYVELAVSLLNNLVKWKNPADSIKTLVFCLVGSIVFHYVDFFYVFYAGLIFAMKKIND
jgi:hypothetical protein